MCIVDDFRGTVHNRFWQLGSTCKGHNSKPSLYTQTKQADGAYYLLAREGSVEVSIKLDDHDYEEPYFEPASEEEGLLQQLRKMSIPMVDEEKEIQ